MAHIARSAGVRVILVVPASNLTDFTPFKSEHSPLNAEQLQQWESYVAAGRNARARGQPDRAVELLSAAQRLDPRHAEGLWLLADALLAAGHEQEAMRHFTRAKDEDVCPLRALSAIEDAVRRVAAEEGLELVDFPRLLEDKYGVVSSKGLDCFLDHVHPTPMCHGDLGWALGQELQALGVVDTIRDSPEFRERIRARVMGQITSVDNVMALHVLAMTLAWAGKNKEALRLTEVAAKALPNDPDVLSQYGRLLEKQGQETKALEVYQQAVKADPKHARALARLGNLYGKRGDYELARRYLQRAVDHCADWQPIVFRTQIRNQLGDCLKALGDDAAAERLYREAARLAPPHSGVQELPRE
jgi:tetratricopeptide (TPR) repeat protein